MPRIDSPRTRLPRAARLSAKAQFDAVLAAPTRWHTEFFRLHVRPDPTCAPARLGMTVPKRIAPKASERNRLRRHMRESFRTREPYVHGFDLVLVAKPQAVGRPCAALRADLHSGLRRIAGKLGSAATQVIER